MSYYLRFPDFKYKAVTLSYDDGVIYDRQLIEIMNRYGLKGTFNLNSGLFGVNNRKLTEKEAFDLYNNSGHEVAVHGERHLSLGDVDKAMAAFDVINDRNNLEKLFGTIIKGMAYANGSFNEQTTEVLESCGINYARTVLSTGKFDLPNDWLRLNPTCHHKDPKLIDYVKEFLNLNSGRKPLLFYLWGHSYEFNDNNNWYIIENFGKEIGNRDDIWYATNGEIYDYVMAYNNLIFSADGQLIKNSANIDIYLHCHSKNVKISAGSMIRIS